MSGAELSLPSDPVPVIAPVEPDWTGYLETRTGFQFFTRPATPGDSPELDHFFDALTSEDMRFRFLSAIRKGSPPGLAAMTAFDHRRTENFLAYDVDRTQIFATAMVAADSELKSAEVAIAILPAYRDRGASWSLLEHIIRFAKCRELKTLLSIESRDHHRAIDLERDMGFTVASFPGDATLVLLTFDLANDINMVR